MRPYTSESDDEVVLEPPEGSREDGVAPDLLFLRVPEGKVVNRHLMSCLPMQLRV